MIVVKIKDGDNIEKGLKMFKRKCDRCGIIKEVRTRQQYNKPSNVHRKKIQHAVYVQKLKEIAAE